MIKLVPVIFDIMRRCLDLGDHHASEYLKQLLLSCTLNICAKIEGEEEQLEGLHASCIFYSYSIVFSVIWAVCKVCMLESLAPSSYANNDRNLQVKVKIIDVCKYPKILRPRPSTAFLLYGGFYAN
jgi:hypothetical protein